MYVHIIHPWMGYRARRLFQKAPPSPTKGADSMAAPPRIAAAVGSTHPPAEKLYVDAAAVLRTATRDVPVTIRGEGARGEMQRVHTLCAYTTCAHHLLPTRARTSTHIVQRTWASVTARVCVEKNKF